LVTASGIATEVALGHLQKEWLLIRMTEFAMTTDTKPSRLKMTRTNDCDTILGHHCYSILAVLKYILANWR